jgi:SAM-dependent methyltransferase
MQLVERTAYPGFHQEILKGIPALGKNAPILDLGCGTGAWLEALAERGYTDLTGVDWDGTTYASAFGCQRARFVGANLENADLPLPEGHYRLITAIEVLEHLSCPGALFRLAMRHLHEEGVLIVTTPNIQSLEARLRFLLTDRLPSFDFRGDPSHVLPQSLVTLERMMKREGLAIQRVWGIPSRGQYRWPIRVGAAVLRPFLPETAQGICVAIEAKKCAS